MANRRPHRALTLAVIFVVALIFGLGQVNAQALSEHKLNSQLMARELPYRVVVPKNYDADKMARFPVVYLLHGLGSHFNSWGDSGKIVKYLEPYNFIVVMPEGNNGWYTDSATVPGDKYESYIVKELIPEIDKDFRTISTRDGRIIAGLSMGGYGSLKFGLKYPEMFTLVGSFSGALAAASWNEKMLNSVGAGSVAQSIGSVYGADDSQTRKDNDIFKITKDLTPDRAKQLPFIYLDCGTEDILITNARDFSASLLEKKIPHEYRERPGIHNWVFWEATIQEFLRLAERRLAAAK